MGNEDLTNCIPWYCKPHFKCEDIQDGKRIDDGEDYYRCSRNIEVCLPCNEKYGICNSCTLCNR